MLKIYYTLEAIFDKLSKKSSSEFQKGFKYCLCLLHLGINKHPQINYVLECRKLEDQLEGLRKELKYRDIQINTLKKKLNHNSIASQSPLDYFKEYFVQTMTLENFSIFTNMKLETFQNMSTNFAARYKYTTLDECKAMMLQYINSHTSYGFKAYKDEKTALKDNVIIK